MTTISNNTQQYKAKAFVSCSLRQEDKPFVDYVESILKYYDIEPFGTVGRYSASPENPAVLMKNNIPLADFVVICATSRYIKKDLQTGHVSYGLSEMIDVETGIAYANDKPVIVFVKEGTSVGSFIPNITQYITLNGKKSDYESKKHLIYVLLNSTYLLTKKIKDKINNDKALKTAGKVIIYGLAFYGAIKFIEFITKKK